ncbi:MAG: TlpA family protein disulfide reductase [Blastocatellia bacterium]|nr:TlpA family protein disulfide reductase [Blastocatellia bacterium]
MKKYVISILLASLLTGCDTAPTTTTNTSSTAVSPPAVTSTSTSVVNNNEDLRARWEKLTSLSVGESIPEVKASDLAGRNLTVASREHKNGELLIIYSPTCHVCHDTMPKWIELYKQFFQPRNIPILGVSVLNDVMTVQSVNEMKIPFPVASIPDIDFKIEHKISNVPTTLILDSTGTIRKMWVGNLDEKAMSDIVTHFCPECNVQVTK